MALPDLKQFQIWFVTGSQNLYGTSVLHQVDEHSLQIATSLNQDEQIPVSIIFKPVLKSAVEIFKLCQMANIDKKCIGLILWMHTFSPAKMWINGLKILHKPFVHLHTQFNRDIPWKTIDMDFMNLNQSAHGDREFGHICSRMRINRKVITGHWEEKRVREQLSIWMRAASAYADWQGARFVRFGDNMRDVSVTEGDKVEAELKFGYSVNTYGINDLKFEIDQINENDIDKLCQEYEEQYDIVDELKKEKNQSLREAAKIELGLRKFLEKGNYKGFTDTFEDLDGLRQLPGIAVQRLMKDGYGFGAEGDWKTATIVRALKVMSIGLKNGGNSFMEDYTYHLETNNEMVLGAHMLEICESIASTKQKPSCEIHPLGIGGKEDPVRLVFNSDAGSAINLSLIDMGNRFRLLINEVNAIEPLESLPNLPVARVIWKPKPDMRTACTAWILAGGAHHTCYSRSITTEYIRDFAEIIGNIECIVIDDKTTIDNLKNELKWNDMYYLLHNK
ncbi:unnamed protein product [Adineta steineri]|uniref:L-arabinose isomerase n=1 Tax=Adineta steineri TaxID=433720 RepID=A0A819M118_9BILA|nr:unnamed protein product [Adineta steineri]CAF3972116.1 unnamed protein product [Adineta steineri]